jgi:hypothetical protein
MRSKQAIPQCAMAILRSVEVVMRAEDRMHGNMRRRTELPLRPSTVTIRTTGGAR